MINRNVVECIIVNAKGEFLLQKKSLDYPTKPGEGKWCLFGGGLDEKENPKEGIKRELVEETNLSFENVRFFKKYNYEMPPKFKGKQTVFISNFEGDLSEISLKEGAGFAFFSYAEMESLNIDKLDKKALEDYSKLYPNNNNA